MPAALNSNLSLPKRTLTIFAVLALSAYTYLYNYDQPARLYWDEAYHVASAERYLQGVFFMEPHPPLGKLFIALGELIVEPNKEINKSELVNEDHLKEIPKGLSFKGYRLFPALFGWLSCFLFFIICLQLTRSYPLAALASSAVIFDNALILHSRAAMLESAQIFFILATICLGISHYQYFKSKPLQKKATRELASYLALGALFGAAISVKVTSLILLLLLAALILIDAKMQQDSKLKVLINALAKISCFVFSAAIIFIIQWQIHFSLATKINNNKLYEASAQYLMLLKEGQNDSFSNFSIMLRDSYHYFKRYEKGVPKLNPFKENENGSHPSVWPVMGGSISYRWERVEQSETDTTELGAVRYLYLIPNPAVWFLAFIALLSSLKILAVRLFWGHSLVAKADQDKLTLLLLGYLGYMFVMFQIPRVMYLYHYFIPLLFSLLMGVVLINSRLKLLLEKRNIVVWTSLVLLALNIFTLYHFFLPITSYEPLSSYEFMRRSWFEYWRLRPIL